MSRSMKVLPGSEIRGGWPPAFAVPLVIMVIGIIGGCSSSTKPEPVVPGAHMVSENHLYWSELTATGTDRLIGRIQTADGTPVSVTDIARAPDGRLYAVSFSQLYSINSETAIATPIGSGLPDRTNALGFNGAGELFAATANTGTLYRIDPATGGVTPLGTYGASWRSSGDLVFRPDGVLLATIARQGDAQDALATISVTTGAATVMRSDLPSRMYGMCVVDGVVYGATDADRGLYIINPSTGAFARVRTISFAAFGSKGARN